MNSIILIYKIGSKTDNGFWIYLILFRQYIEMGELNMKEVYVNAEVEIIDLGKSDIIVTSGCEFELPRDDEE